ncbi:MAG: hypothetical protein AMXMBFR33_44090 [Candidatus Xenobia bacterium]
MTQSKIRCRVALGLVSVALLVSGVTAFPLPQEVGLLAGWLDPSTPLGAWIHRVEDALVYNQENFPFMAYGTDWLAFAHIMLAVLFLGAMRDPARNLWVIEFGLLACAGVLALALICGPLRGIPFFWQLVDCSFGAFGAIPLWFARREALSASAG